MVCAAVSQSWKSPLIVVKLGVKINTDRYIKDILVLALEEMEKSFKDHPSPSKKMEHHPTPPEKKTQNWCQHPFPRFWSKEMWPPASLDFNPIVYLV